MHPKRNARRIAFWGALAAIGLAAGAGRAQPPEPPPQPVPLNKGLPGGAMPPPEVKIDPKTGTLIVPVGGQVMWSPKLPQTPIDVFTSREVVEVRGDPSDTRRYFLKGLLPGVAQVTFRFKDFPPLVFEVSVEPDLDRLRSIIKRTVPTSAVEVQAGIGTMIVLSGYVTSPQDAETVARLAAAYAGNPNNLINAIQVGGVQQVQIDVVVASVDRTMARFRGLDFAVNGATVNFESIVSGLISGSLVQGTSGSSSLLVNTAANLQMGVVPWNFFVAMQALRSEGIAKFLAEPKVVTQSGRPAFFLAGGQQAILSQSSGITGPGVTLVPFGTQLDVLPIVYDNGKIWLEIDPKITAVDQALGISVGGALSPGFTQQEVRSAVMLESGQTYAIGGLIQNTVQANAAKVPVLGDLPFLGVAFSMVNHTQTETELVIMVTPRLVAPMNCDQVPKRMPGRETRNPDDYELFLENILEAPRGQRKVWNGHCYNAAYKCDPTAAYFPCVGGVCTGRVGPMMAPPGGYPPAGAQAAPTPAKAPPVVQLPSGAAANTPAYPVVPGSPVTGVGGSESSNQAPLIVIPDVSLPRN